MGQGTVGLTRDRPLTPSSSVNGMNSKGDTRRERYAVLLIEKCRIAYREPLTFNIFLNHG
jgi:hypothetical protein